MFNTRAGADIVGAGELVASILDSKGKSIDFSACLATPDMMPQMVKLGRILGPKGLMPNPKVCRCWTCQAFLLVYDCVGCGCRCVVSPETQCAAPLTPQTSTHAPIHNPLVCPSFFRLQIGTLTDNLTGAIAELRQGRVEFKMDRTGIVHAPIGKASFEQHDLLLNLGALTGIACVKGVWCEVVLRGEVQWRDEEGRTPGRLTHHSSVFEHAHAWC